MPFPYLYKVICYNMFQHNKNFFPGSWSKLGCVQMVCMKQLNKMINVFYKVQTPQARRLIALIFNEGWGIPATGASNGMAGGADLILQGNTSLHTARRGNTPCRVCCPCRRCVSGGGGTGGGGPLWVVCGCYWPPGGPLWVVRGS